MHRQLTFGLLIAVLLVISAVAQDGSNSQPSSIWSVLVALPSDASTIHAILATEPHIPLGPPDLLKRYEQEMQTISQRTYAELAQIADAARGGQLSRPEAEYLSNQRYQLGIMQFQLINTLYQSLVSDMDRAEKRPSSNPTVLVASTSPSAEVPQDWATYLGLTTAQLSAVQAQVEEERRLIRPLVERVANTRRALIMATRRGRFDEAEVRRLAADESQIQQELIVADARLQTKVYKLLTAEQQEKVDRMREETVAPKPTYAYW